MMYILWYLPLIQNSGSTVMAMKMTQMGVKQTINMAEIMTTILEALWSRPEELSEFHGVVDFLRQAALLFNYTTSRAVATMTTMKALKGMKMLLTANRTLSTDFWSWV